MKFRLTHINKWTSLSRVCSQDKTMIVVVVMEVVKSGANSVSKKKHGLIKK